MVPILATTPLNPCIYVSLYVIPILVTTPLNPCIYVSLYVIPILVTTPLNPCIYVSLYVIPILVTTPLNPCIYVSLYVIPILVTTPLNPCIYVSLYVIPRVDKQVCATPDLSCTICRYPAPTAEFFVDVTFFQRNADFAAEQCESTCWAPTLQCKARPSARGKPLQKARSACVVEKITSTKNSAVGQPIRELHTLVYLLLVIPILVTTPLNPCIYVSLYVVPILVTTPLNPCIYVSLYMVPILVTTPLNTCFYGSHDVGHVVPLCTCVCFKSLSLREVGG